MGVALAAVRQRALRSVLPHPRPPHPPPSRSARPYTPLSDSVKEGGMDPRAVAAMSLKDIVAAEEAAEASAAAQSAR